MSKYPVRRAQRALRKVEENGVEVIRPVAEANPFVSFRYSYTEISASGGKAHVRSRKTRFEDGKLTSESFEGEFDRGAYEQTVRHVQQYILDQTTLWLKSLSWLLPFAAKQRPDRD